MRIRLTGSIGIAIGLILTTSGAAADPPAVFREANAILERAIAARAFPGCAVVVGRATEPLWIAGLGHTDYSKRVVVTPDTLYDLASLTKVVGTTSVAMALIRDGALDLDARVAQLVPALATDGRKRLITVRQLLLHRSGFPAWKPLYRRARGAQAMLEAVCAEPLAAPPGEVARYSDLGIILLGEVLGRARGKPLERLERELVFDPLGLRSTTRRPRGLGRPVAPTESWPEGEQTDGSRFIQGVVHDENARAAGGGTGHAGLFSSARDLSRFAAELLRGCQGESRLFPRRVLERFTRVPPDAPPEARPLGWARPTAGGWGGHLLGETAFGHTGFTGTLIWLDPGRDLYLVLLTNRVHPSRENHQLFAVRTEFSDAVVRAADRARARTSTR